MKAIINNITSYLLKEEKRIRVFFIIFYTVGVFGIVIPLTRNLFFNLTPLALLLSVTAVLIFHKPQFEIKTVILFTSIYILTFIIETAGVKTGLIFGNYTYGNGLGIKVLDTPLLIGINWVLLVYCTAVIVERLHSSTLIKPVLSSLLMVLYDVIMEQIAPQLDMWDFKGDTVPLRNYIAWFILALLFHSILKIAGIQTINRLAPFIFYCQTIFFIALMIFFKLVQ